MLDGPMIADGVGLTVTVVVVVQKPAIVYVMTVVPKVPPVTTPVAEPIVATPVLLLTHVPPLTASVRVMVAPTHTAVGPLIGAGMV